MLDDLAKPPRGDLPRGAGPLARTHRFFGDLMIAAVQATRPPLTLGVRLLAFDAAGRIYLVRHSYVPGWHLPGGGVEAGETMRESVTREAEEEGGLVLPEPAELFGVYANSSAWRHDHLAVFIARGVTAGPARTGLEIREAGFFAVDALPEATSLGSRARIAEALGAPRADRW